MLLLLSTAIAFRAAKNRSTSMGLLSLKRISDPQISPDSRWVAFTVQTVDVTANKKPSQIWITPLEGGAAPAPDHAGGARPTRVRAGRRIRSASPMSPTAADRRRSG